MSAANGRIDRVLQPLQEFLRLEAAGGIVLMFGAVVGLLCANTPLSAIYDRLLDVPLAVQVGNLEIAKPLLLWINDGLMAVFFFLVGMELKREVLEGHLSSLRTAGLPAFAAAGGMLVPAAVYAVFNWGDAAAMKGWAIPTATDIAFALGILSLLGDRVPAPLKVLLLSVAIFDDLAAILVIAVFYTAELSLAALSLAAALVLALLALNRLGVTRTAAYLLVGVPLWVAVLKSGVHATLAGVVVAMFIPLRGQGDHSPLKHLEHALHPWVAFGVMPVFAFANAGVPVLDLSLDQLFHPIPLGIMGGLVVGKLVGFVGASWLATVLGVASLPAGVRWSHVVGTGLLSGVGFTMSLFIAGLAFEQGGGAAALGLERLGILIGSLLAGSAGYVLLSAALPKRPQA